MTDRTKHSIDESPIWKSLDIPIKRASECTVEDFDGNEYLDLFSGISVTNVGHCNEAAVQAAKTQLDEFVHGCRMSTQTSRLPTSLKNSPRSRW